MLADNLTVKENQRIHIYSHEIPSSGMLSPVSEYYCEYLCPFIKTATEGKAIKCAIVLVDFRPHPSKINTYDSFV